ncbi:MAG: Uma2 family endonuclease [Verrucomicrobiota bacterium]|nr:Uma2 family endonuclease [Verrucomicrobiota bacterium]MCC6821907.1 Uma2 family endonuclease [Limisphaerales bacterium]
MSEPYEEVFAGEATLRLPPGRRHELICSRLHAAVKSTVANIASTRLLEPRTAVEMPHATRLCPDLALITAATHKLWLAAEIVNSEDHHADTVLKKELYETIKVPRLWMIDPRYGNVEVYHATPYGLALKGILAGREVLSEVLLPEFALVVAELFAPE